MPQNPRESALQPSPSSESPPSFLEHAILAVQGCVLLFLDETGRMVSCNAEAHGIKSYVGEDEHGKPCSCSFAKPGQRCQISAHVLKAAETRGQYEANGWLQRTDAEPVWAHLSVSPVYDDARKVSGYAAFIHDVSKKRAAEHALYNSEKQFRMLVQGVRDYAIYMLDADGYITNWNAGAALIKGYTADEIIGQHYSTFYTPEDRERGEPQRALETALRDNTFQNEAWRVRKDGSHFWASVVIDPIYDEHGKLLGFAKITRDVTTKKRDLEKADRQRETLHQSQKLEALGRLTGTVAHDFNNMLSIIRTAAEMLGSGMRLAHDNDHYIRMITDTSERAARLTGQLLAFARQQPLRPEVFSPAERIEGLRSMMDTTIGSRNTLYLSFAEDVARVESDVSQFETAVLNLVINARDAMSEGGSVTISARNITSAVDEDGEARDWVAIEVRDTGTGIEPAVLSRVFEPFFTTKAVNEGTGLGLSQVYGYVKQSGGDIKVESAPGEGTAFTLYLPAAKSREDDDDWGALLTPAAKEAMTARAAGGTAPERMS